MKKLLPIFVSLFIAFVCPIIISVEFQYLSGRQLGVFGTAISMFLCIVFAIGIYPKMQNHLD